MKPKNFISTDPANHKGKSDVWLTPLSLIKSLGEFDLDPCAFADHETAPNKMLLPHCDGLVNEWFGKVWLNPPYSDLEKWLDKLADHGFGTALVFNRLDTKCLQRHVKKASSVFFIAGRIKFLNSDFKESNNAGVGNILISYGYTPDYKKLNGWKAK